VLRFDRGFTRHGRGVADGNVHGDPVTDGSFTVFLVDDDAGVLKALSRLLRARRYGVKSYTSPQAFLADHDPSIPGCAVLDVSMPGLDGLALQQALAAGDAHRPIIFITGKGGRARGRTGHPAAQDPRRIGGDRDQARDPDPARA
jgi:CheY-like chemotaxis protein